MTDLSQAPAVIASIRRYADAYAGIQHLQEKSGLIPPGDQKTGCIGEFFIYLYLSGKHPGEPLRYGGHSNKGWDIELGPPGRSKRIQTKTVSAYSTTRRLSPISSGWDELYVVYLGFGLFPEGFWIIEDQSILPDSGSLKHCSAPHPMGRFAGTAAIPFGRNRIDELNRYLHPHVTA